jgi:hypothetical protein
VAFACPLILEEAGARRRRAKRVEETRAVEKADVARTCKIERLHAVEGLIEVDRADRLGARERNDLAERDGAARMKKNRFAHTQSNSRPPRCKRCETGHSFMRCRQERGNHELIL